MESDRQHLIDTLNEEIWKPVKGFEGSYEVSNLGKIRNFINKRYGFRKDPLLLRGGTAGGYKVIGLVNLKTGIRKMFAVHRLVAIAFLGEWPEKTEINHKNGNKHDNRLENLEWVTRSENLKHSFRIKIRDNDGVNNPKAKLTKADVLLIRELRKKDKKATYSVLVNRFSVSQSAIYFILARRTWKYI